VPGILAVQNTRKTQAHSQIRRPPTSDARTRASRNDWQEEERRVLQALARAEQKGKQVLIAQGYSNLGNLAEKQGRLGDAFRHWSRAIAVLRRLKFVGTAEYERLLRLLRLWHETPPVWISYARKDATHVRRILAVLRRKRIRVISDVKFAAGHSIQRQILDAIVSCPKGIVFWSKNALASEWVGYETAILNELQKQRRRDLRQKALDNVVIFYCLDDQAPPNYFRGDLQILEPELGLPDAITQLVQGLKTSELLTTAGRL
jgi:hypothetical protein